MENKILDTNIYDYETKNLFLESIENKKSKNAYKSLLLQIARYEKEINTPIYKMSIYDAKNCIDTLTRTTINASNTLLSKIATYFFWTTNNHFTEDTETYGWIKGLKGEDIVSKIAMSNQYLKKSDLYNISCRNAQDRALLILLFLGVEGTEMCELRNIRKYDIDFNSNIIHLKGYSSIKNQSDIYKRDIKLTDGEMEVIKEALNQTSYYIVERDKKEGKIVTNLRALAETDMLFKNIDYSYLNKKSSYIVQRSELNKRIRTISKEVKIPLNAKNIVMSGEIYELTQLKKNFKDITQEDYIKVLKKYNKKVNLSSINTLSALYGYLVKNEIEVAVTQ